MVERMIGAALLNPATYEEVEADQDATVQALLIVVLAAIASGIGSVQRGIAALIAGVIIGIIGWVLYSAAAYWVGTAIFRGPETRATVGQVLRALGFANTPRLLLVLGFIPVLGPLIALVVFIWTLVTTVVAIRQALDFDTGRAIGTAIVAVLLLIIPYLVVAAVLL